jgi:hypothetical protein
MKMQEKETGYDPMDAKEARRARNLAVRRETEASREEGGGPVLVLAVGSIGKRARFNRNKLKQLDLTYSGNLF